MVHIAYIATFKLLIHHNMLQSDLAPKVVPVVMLHIFVVSHTFLYHKAISINSLTQ